MSLLAFLTGFGGGAAKIAEQEREQVQQDQSAELEYRRKNLEHMVQAAEEGRVNPDLVGRVFEEYMNAMPGLSSRPRGKGVGARFLGKRDLGESSLMRDLGSGAVSLFGKQPGALNIDWNAAKPKTEGAGFNIPTGMPGMPSVPHVEHQSGKPVGEVVNQGYQQALPPAGGNWLYEHPETTRMRAEQSMLQQLLGSESIKSLIDTQKMQTLYGNSLQRRWGSRSNPSMFTNITAVRDPNGNVVRIGLNKETNQIEVVPTEGDLSNLVPPSWYNSYTNDLGGVTPVLKGTAAPPGTGRSTAPRYPHNPPQPTDERLADLERKRAYDEVVSAINNDFTARFARGLRRETAEQVVYARTIAPDILAKYPTWKQFKNANASRLVASPIPGARSSPEANESTMSDVELTAALKASFAARAAKAASPKAPVK